MLEGSLLNFLNKLCICFWVKAGYLLWKIVVQPCFLDHTLNKLTIETRNIVMDLRANRVHLLHIGRLFDNVTDLSVAIHLSSRDVFLLDDFVLFRLIVRIVKDGEPDDVQGSHVKVVVVIQC